jgi:hypothetical protein
MKINFKETQLVDVNWINMALNGDRWKAVVNTVTNFRVR